MTTPDLKILINRCLQGDRHAQSRFYRLFVQDIYNMVIRMTADKMLAEDIVQETFIKVFKKLGTFRGEAQISTWMKRIAINIALYHLKKRGRIQFVEVEDHLLVDSEREEEEIDIRQIHEAIKKLPEGCRLVFTLYLLEGYRHREIAEIVGISESTSKSQYQRAKSLLRELLNHGSIRKKNSTRQGCSE